ncbi:7049_t:CDS:2, partial [Gigaspora rosea]
STNAVIALRPEQTLTNKNHNAISQQAIISIISLLNYDNNCHQITSITQPIKEAIHNLEACTTNLSNCFVSIVNFWPEKEPHKFVRSQNICLNQLLAIASAINGIPSNNAFYKSAIKISIN